MFPLLEKFTLLLGALWLALMQRECWMFKQGEREQSLAVVRPPRQLLQLKLDLVDCKWPTASIAFPSAPPHEPALELMGLSEELVQGASPGEN